MNLPDTFKSNRSLFSDFFRDLDELFTMSPLMMSPWTSNSLLSNGMASGMNDNFINPNVEFQDDEDHYVLVFEIPGVRQEDLKVDLTNNVLTVSGERRQEIGDESKRVSGRRYGNFRRSFSLPQGTNVEDVNAHCENGILEIVIPKTAEGQRRSIEIQQGKAARRDVLTGSKAQSDEQVASKVPASQSGSQGSQAKETRPRH